MAASMLSCLWGSQTQTVVPAESERRLLGAEGDKPGLSPRLKGLGFPSSGLRRGVTPPTKAAHV